MPTYVYSCDVCGQQFEHFQSFKDAPLDTCICGKQGSVRRVFQPVGIVFKGSGWYINDSRKNSTDSSSSGDTDNKDSSGDKAESSSKAETSSETASS